MNDSLIGDLYRYEAPKTFDAIAYSRSVNAFHCNICKRGFQRPTDENLEHFQCDHCQAHGTKQDLSNSLMYRNNMTIVKPRYCNICGGLIRPAPELMQWSQWWLQETSRLTFICPDCSFTGTLSDFRDEAHRQSLPMFDRNASR